MKILFSLLAFCLFASCVHSQEALDKVCMYSIVHYISTHMSKRKRTMI